MRILKFAIWLAAAGLAVVMFTSAPAQDVGGKSNLGKKARETDPTRTQGGGGNLDGYDPNDPTPVPRLADGKPDFSGIWTNMGGNLGQDPLPGFVEGGAAIWNVPRDPNRDDPSGFYCMPSGMPRIISDPYPLQLVQKPGLIVFLYEYEHMYRIITTTGDPIPKDPPDAWMGNSVAHWEGDTLVIDTVGFTVHPYHWFDGAGHVTSEDLHITERMMRKSFQTITYDVTFEDPKVWVKPWTQHKRLALRPKWKITEYICEENNRTALRGLQGSQPRYDSSRTKK